MTPPANPSKKRRNSRRKSTHQPPVIARKSMWHNLPTWLMLVITLSINFITVGYTYATLESKSERNKEEIIRNERDDRERETRLQAQITSLQTQISTMNQLRTDVEVMKNSLASINDTLRRLERRIEQVTTVPPTTTLPPVP